MKKGVLLVFGLLILNLLFRLPSLFEPYWYGDEGITITVGQQLRRGAVIYKDIVDNKPPLLYLLAACTFNLFNFKLLTLFWSLLTVFFFLRLTKELVPKREILSSLVFIFLTSTPILEGNIINGEIYGILPIILSVFLFWQRHYFLSGVSASFSCLFKHPFFFDFLSLLTFLVFFTRSSLKDSFLKILKLEAGFLLPLLLTTGYLYYQGALRDFINQAILNNLKYISWQTDFLIPHGLTVVKTLILLLIVAIFYKKRGEFSKRKIFIFLWLTFSLFGATISNRPYPHYLLQVAPSFSLTMGILFTPLGIFLIILTLTIATTQFKLGSHSLSYLISYYQNFLRGNSPLFYDPQVKTTYEIAEFLKKNTKADEGIFVWSDNTLIYALSQRRPVGRYPAAYHIKNNIEREGETIKTLSSKKPRFIILTLPVKHKFPALATLLQEEYNLIKESSRYLIYEAKN